MALTFNLPSQIVVQTAAQWAADTTVYTEKRILVTSDEYYGNSNQRKFKIADGTNDWATLSYFGSELNDLNIFGLLGIEAEMFWSLGAPINLTGSTNNLDIGASVIVILTSTGAQDLTGLVAQQGKIICLYNANSTDIITLKNSSASSTSGNRFDFYPASDFSLNPKQMIFLANINAKWRLLSSGSGGGVTSVTGTAPVVSSGGATPAISMAAASTTVDGYLSSANFQILKASSNIFSIFRSGMWLSTPYTSITSGAGWTAGSIRAYPIAITQDVTFANIRAEITGAIAGSNIRLGIASNDNGYPGATVFDSGDISCATTGMKTSPVNMSFTASDRIIWLLLNMSVGTIGFRYASSTISYLGRPAAGGTTIGGAYRVASAFGAFPATYPAGATTEAHPLNAPLVEIEVA